MTSSDIIIRSIGIIGAGQMGSGIAHVCALAGYDVRLADVDPKALEQALGTVDRNLSRQITRGRISEAEKAAALKHIRTGTQFDLFGD